MPAKSTHVARQDTIGTTWPDDVTTLAIDVGGSGVKASILDQHGNMTTQRLRVETPYPCPPRKLVGTIESLVADLPKAHRMSVGFPGLVRNGVVYHVPSLSRLEYGGEEDPGMRAAWSKFDLAGRLADAFAIPVKVVNDADMQGCAVATGQGLEFVMTLGTGCGTALFYDGALLPHLELSHGPFLKHESFDIILGNASRKALGISRWRKRVSEAVRWFDEMLFFDHIFIGGGNAKHLDADDLGHKASIISNTAGITGGVRVWELAD